jgi:hypothetical protein
MCRGRWVLTDQGGFRLIDVFLQTIAPEDTLGTQDSVQLVGTIAVGALTEASYRDFARPQ